jgi:Na+/H+ antiporter NhaD/arsenite permease-like protein
LAAVTVELAKLLKFNPVPVILSEIFCANLGGSATMCGDPPNIIIGTSLGYSFADFITNTGVIAGIGLIFTVIYFYFVFRKELDNGNKEPDNKPDPKSAIKDMTGFIMSTVIFLIAVVLLVTHAQTHLTVAFIGVLVSVLTLITAPKHIVYIIKKVDYKTLLFFIGLFVVVGGLEQTGILEILAGLIGKLSGGNVMLMIAIIIWVSAICSAFIDNIPFAATMIPVIAGIAASLNIDATPLYFGLLTGATLGGNCTPVGASANIAGIGILKKAGYNVKNSDFFRIGIPFTIAAVVPSYIYIWLMYGI